MFGRGGFLTDPDLALADALTAHEEKDLFTVHTHTQKKTHTHTNTHTHTHTFDKLSIAKSRNPGFFIPRMIFD